MKKILFLIITLSSFFAFSQSDGTLDTSFGNGGKVFTNISSGNDFSNDAVQLSDKSIIVCGYTNLNGQDAVLVKYSEDGTLDSGFGSNGISILEIGQMHSEFYTIALQSNGKIIAAGTSGDSYGHATFARFHPDGTLDTSFANNGILRSYTGHQSNVEQVLITPEDEIIGVGYSSNDTGDIQIIKLTSDGAFDASFGINGIATLDPINRGERPFAATFNQEKILVAGVGRVEGNNYEASMVVQVNSDGTLDSTFGNNGYVSTQFGNNGTFTYERFQSIDVKNGKIYASGFRNTTSTEFHITLMRLNADGTLDQTFANSGKLLLDTPSIADYIYDLRITNDNHILLAGSTAYGHYSNREFLMLKLNSDGTFNPEFGNGGMVRNTMNSNSSMITKLILNQNNIIAIGASNTTSSPNLALAKFHHLDSIGDIYSQCIVNESDVMSPAVPSDCGGNATVTHNATFPITEQGTTIITWTIDDGCGNVTTQIQNVVIEDTIAPTPTVAILPDIAAQCEVTQSDVTVPTATDNCGGSVTVTHNATFPISTQGTTVITWTFEDENGNTSTQTQNVIIEDTSAPVPTLGSLPNITAQCEVNQTDVTIPTATDNCGGTVTVTNDAVFPITSQGTTVITWTFEDENGNTSTQTHNVIIDDTTAPVPTLGSLPNITAQCEVHQSDVTIPTATDNCGGTVTMINDVTFPISTQGTTVITWTFEDENGNTSTQTQNVIIDDTTAPVPTLGSLPNITAQCEVTQSDVTVPTATDNCGGTVTITNDTTFPISTHGTTVITWTYEDENGNTSTQTQNLIIDDTQNPTIEVENISLDLEGEGMISIDANMFEDWADDNCGVDSIALSQTTFNCGDLGENTVTITVTDVNGNSTQEDFTVTINDPDNFCEILSVSDNVRTEFTLYPNPARGKVFVKPSSQVTIQKITVYSLTGERIKIENYNSVMDQYEVKLNHLDAGIYILHIETSAGIFTKKLLVKE